MSAGVLDEVKSQVRTAFSRTSAHVIGLAALQAHLRGEIDLPTCLEAIKTATRRYAKRQMTWFRGQGGFMPIDLSAMGRNRVIDEAVKQIHMTQPVP